MGFDVRYDYTLSCITAIREWYIESEKNRFVRDLIPEKKTKEF